VRFTPSRNASGLAQHRFLVLQRLGLGLGELLLDGLLAFLMNGLFLHLVEVGTGAALFKRVSNRRACYN